MEDHDIRAALDRHWAASDANDFEAEHQIYREDAVLEYPQSGERIRGRRNIQVVSCRAAEPETLHGAADNRRGDLWVTEFTLTYDADGRLTRSASWSSETGRWPARPNTSAIRSSRDLRALNGSSGCPETERGILFSLQILIRSQVGGNPEEPCV